MDKVEARRATTAGSDKAEIAHLRQHLQLGFGGLLQALEAGGAALELVSEVGYLRLAGAGGGRARQLHFLHQRVDLLAVLCVRVR